MRETVLLIALLLIPVGLFAQTPAVSYQQQSWDLGNNLSKAALSNALGIEHDMIGRFFSSAEANAKNLGIKLPALPPSSHDKAADGANALFYLLKTTGMPIMKILTEDFGSEHAALFELSFKTNILLLIYLPDSKETAATLNVLDRQSETAKLPTAVFSKLQRLAAAKAGFDEIEKEIFTIQNVTSMYVAVREFGENGEIFYARKEFARSADEFSKALRISPEDPKYYFLRARSYLQMDKNLEAAADYTQVIRLARTETEKSNLPTAYKNRGLAYGLLKKNALAIADLNMAVKLNPGDAGVYKIRGLVYRQAGNAKLAEADHRKAESLQPGIMRN